MIFLNKSQLDKGIEQLKAKIKADALQGVELCISVFSHLPNPELVDELLLVEFYDRLVDYFPVFNTVDLTNFRMRIFKFQSDEFSIVTDDAHSFTEFRKQWIEDEIERVKAAIIEVDQKALLTPSLKSLYKINLRKHIDHISQYLAKPARANYKNKEQEIIGSDMHAASKALAFIFLGIKMTKTKSIELTGKDTLYADQYKKLLEPATSESQYINVAPQRWTVFNEDKEKLFRVLEGNPNALKMAEEFYSKR